MICGNNDRNDESSMNFPPHLNIPKSKIFSSMKKDQKLRHPPQVSCIYHPEFPLMNFCKNSDCLMPLCANCVSLHTIDHSQNGTYGQFDTIENVLCDSEKNLMNLDNKLREDFNNLKSFKIDLLNQFEGLKGELNSTKEKVYKVQIKKKL